jgi:hypothetical protein
MNKQAALDRLTALEKEAAELRKIIDAPEKPAIRHGDYGHWTRSVTRPECCFRYAHGKDGKIVAVFETATIWGSGEESGGLDVNEYAHEFVILGNIFDDLKLWGEDCEKWETRSNAGRPISARLDANHVELRIADGWMADLRPDKAIELANKIKQIAFTAKRKQNR